MNKKDIILKSISLYPSVLQWSNALVRQYITEACKTYDYFLQVLTRLVRSVYAGLLGGEFIDILANLLQGQITQAYEQAWVDDGNPLPIPEAMQAAANEAILKQFDYVDQFFRDIVDAKIDNTPIEPLLARAELWANRYQESYNDAKVKIALEYGGKLKWVEGDTQDKCETCLALDGIVAYATVWDNLGVYPQSAPNESLDCGGWRCQCKLVPTDERQSRDAEARILKAVGRG